jgi:hypothetical protein
MGALRTIKKKLVESYLVILLISLCYCTINDFSRTAGGTRIIFEGYWGVDLKLVLESKANKLMGGEGLVGVSHS